MKREPTYAGQVSKKDELDILFWATIKSPQERLAESWRLNCINNGVPIDIKMDRSQVSAQKRNDG